MLTHLHNPMRQMVRRFHIAETRLIENSIEDNDLDNRWMRSGYSRAKMLVRRHEDREMRLAIAMDLAEKKDADR